ncbi:Nramp family divalent metal transporter [Vibrio taketomensis]|uniref:Nramp family divalent metal transporter n=1 Tax=Vibrio taketomensis TaxID=2572923 RepID=UPI0013899B90|nr:Nramp family divalent metal transporter [Vibrio taketomensis]
MTTLTTTSNTTNIGQAANLKSLKGSSKRLIGPAFIAAIGYIDPGNFATNIESGSAFGYQLLWVVLWANLMAMLIQYLSAKLGIVTGKNLAEHLRDNLPRWAVVPYWIQAEIIAMATDLAEFIGAAVGFQLLLGVSLFEGAAITALFSLAILTLGRKNQKPLEMVIGALLVFVAVIYIFELMMAKPEAAPMAAGLLIPTLNDPKQVYLAAAILGATVMPHVVYLHSALFSAKSEHSAQKRLKMTRVDVLIAMTIAGFVNIAIIAMAAAVFHQTGRSDIASIETAYQTLTPMLGKGAALLFGLSLIASGLSSTVVGTLAGQVVMQGFVHFSIPMWLRRTITMLPAFGFIAMGVSTTDILVASQVVLSFGVALAIIPLLIFTSRRDIMGSFSNNRLTSVLGAIIVSFVLALNGYLLWSLVA